MIKLHAINRIIAKYTDDMSAIIPTIQYITADKMPPISDTIDPIVALCFDDNSFCNKADSAVDDTP